MNHCHLILKNKTTRKPKLAQKHNIEANTSNIQG